MFSRPVSSERAVLSAPFSVESCRVFSIERRVVTMQSDDR